MIELHAHEVSKDESCVEVVTCAGEDFGFFDDENFFEGGITFSGCGRVGGAVDGDD